MTLGLVAGIALSTGPVTVGEIAFDVDTLVGASAALVIGFQAVLFALLTKVYAMQEGFLPHDRRVQKIIDWWSLERGVLLGGLLAVAGLAGLVASLLHWRVNSFGELDPRHSLRIVVPAATALVMSLQAIFASLFVSILGIRRRQHPPLTDAAEEAAGVVDAAAHKVAGERRAAEQAAETTGDGENAAPDEDPEPATVKGKQGTSKQSAKNTTSTKSTTSGKSTTSAKSTKAPESKAADDGEAGSES
ncbi:hypothetical protein ACFQHO_29160 [Actinomadura yumaensis]